jgi:DNA invertase Pin-like site-specific DNA recombinase
MKPAIAYIRVSTTKQGKSGLGLEAQEAALARFAESEGFAYLQTFSETESGKRATTIDPSFRLPLRQPARLARRSSWQSSID